MSGAGPDITAGSSEQVMETRVSNYNICHSDKACVKLSYFGSQSVDTVTCCYIHAFIECSSSDVCPRPSSVSITSIVSAFLKPLPLPLTLSEAEKNEMGEMDTTMQDTMQHCSTLQNCTTPAAAWLQGTQWHRSSAAAIHQQIE